MQSHPYTYFFDKIHRTMFIISSLHFELQKLYRLDLCAGKGCIEKQIKLNNYFS